MSSLRLLAPALAALLAGCAPARPATAQPTPAPPASPPAAAHLADWPPGASPAEVGRRVAENWVARRFDFEVTPRRQYVIYPEVVTWYGALTVADLLGDDALRARLVRKFDTLRTPEGARRIGPDAHVDYRVFGAVPLEIFRQTGDSSYLALGRAFADRQWEGATADGITREARYWVDDMYMLPLVQLQAYRTTGDRTYLDRTARTMVAYLDSLQQPDGLFHHGPGTPFVWGRGDGWIAAGMAELLRDLPAGHPQHARVMAGYTRMMAALLRHQAPEGLWRQLVDRPETWLETSGSGMFAFAMVTGVANGWLDAATYGPAARRAWLGLVAHLDADANVREVSVGTNKASQEVGPDLDTQYRFYLARERRTGDLHGQAPMLWTASALLRAASPAAAGPRGAAAAAAPACPDVRAAAGTRVLVFSRTAGFRHESIPEGVAAVRRLGERHGFAVEHTEDAAAFDDARLRGVSAVVFLNTTGDVLDAAQQAAFERYVRGGGGFVGVHAAADTEFDWPWFGRLVGAYFARHPAVQPATLHVRDATHLSTRCLPATWARTDEWYDYRAQPVAGTTVLLALDEASYRGATMGDPHPIAWYHAVDGGRAWYTGLGHTRESYAEPAFLAHLAGGILWAAGR